ncbi:MAG: DUF86 domain-containing protein [Methanobacteriaceae archaeon]|nr:DUF86 domain-containing protein [Methanobacteriaceae archaeon]MDO9626010.1 DUF86 domain-containing protein [Methanobacteriaceae archaeon]
MSDDDLFLGHILDEITFIEENFSQISFDSFIKNPVLQRASIRSLEIIGEAVKNSKNFRCPKNLRFLDGR